MKNKKLVIPKTEKHQRVQLNVGVNPDKIFKTQEGTETKTHKIPDPKLHQIISFIKSGIRILGYIFLWYNLDTAAILLILSEVVGILEELT